MDIDIKKNGKIKLKDTPYFEPIDNTNISFSNMDIGTAMITFQIKKNGLPLQVSKKNVWVYAYLESRNGTRSEVIELDVVDSLQGKASLQLDSEFLAGATNSVVDGQLYVTLHKFNDVPDDFSDTVALQEFTFTVKDALINEISGVTKTQYIRTFDQLRTEVKEKIAEMQDNIGNIETLVDRVKQASQDAINQVNDTKNQMIADMQAQYDTTESDIIELRDESIQRLELSATNYINDIKNARTELIQMISDENLITVQKFDEFTADFTEQIDERLLRYESFITDTENELRAVVDDLDWQKYKLTNDNGNSFYLTGVDWADEEFLESLAPGTYYATLSKSYPEGVSFNAFVTVTFRDTGSVKKIEYKPYDSARIFMKYYYRGWSEWEESGGHLEDSGWIPYELINGAVTNSAYDVGGQRNGYVCAYRTVTIGSFTETRVRVNGNSVSHGQVIARLPEGLTASPQVEYIRAPLEHNGTSIILENTGEMKIYISNEPNWENSTSKYFYGELSFWNGI